MCLLEDGDLVMTLCSECGSYTRDQIGFVSTLFLVSLSASVAMVMM